MGGDGWVAPQQRYEIDALLTMDVSGGVAQITLTMDPQFMSVIALAGCLTNQAADDIAFSMDVHLRSSAGAQYRVAGDLKQLHNTNASILWSLPPIVDPASIDFRMVNVDGFTMTATLTVYLFRKSAQHNVPIDKIFQCLPRSGSLN